MTTKKKPISNKDVRISSPVCEYLFAFMPIYLGAYINKSYPKVVKKMKEEDTKNMIVS